MVVTALKSHTAWLVHALGPSPNPLRRPLDRVAAVLTLLLLAAGLMAVPAAATVGIRLYVQESREATRVTESTRQVQAMLISDPRVTNVSGLRTTHFQAEAQWRAPDAGLRSETVGVPPHSVRGQAITLWTDHDGNLTSAPPAQATLVLLPVFVSLWLVFIAETVCAGLLFSVHHLTSRYAQRFWRREWELVQDRWT